MAPPQAILALAVLLAAPLAAQRPLSVTRLGDVKHYGAGIARATITEVQIELAFPGHLIVLRVDPVGGIEPVSPAPDQEFTERAPGLHVITAPAPEPLTAQGRPPEHVVRSADVLARGGQAVRPPAAGPSDLEGEIVAYWLVIVSDSATSAAQVQAILQAARLDFATVRHQLRALPRILVGRRATRWAAWFTPVS